MERMKIFRLMMRVIRCVACVFCGKRCPREMDGADDTADDEAAQSAESEGRR